MTKQIKILLILASVLITFKTSATDLNGRVKILWNDGILYRIMLQINTDSVPQKLGGATITLHYDQTLLGFPDEPEAGVHYSFSNFNGGVYDTATITKVGSNQLWINLDLLIDSLGTQVTGGPYIWTDLVMLNFATNNIVTVPVVYWNVWSNYWDVYDSDNINTWAIGNFDNVSNPSNLEEENENENTSVHKFTLSQNYPNPFNPTTTIRYEIPSNTYVSLIVYDMLGNEVKRLVDSEKSTGVYEVKFDTDNLATGMYIYRLTTGEYSESKKMMFLK
jgi:hypothetical protein